MLAAKISQMPAFAAAEPDDEIRQLAALIERIVDRRVEVKLRQLQALPGEDLKALLRRKKVTCRDVKGVGPGTVSAVARGARPVRSVTIAKIARAIGEHESTVAAAAAESRRKFVS